MKKLNAILSSLLRFKKIDGFGLLPVAQGTRTAQRTADRVHNDSSSVRESAAVDKSANAITGNWMIMSIEIEKELPLRESRGADDLPLQETRSAVSRFIAWLDNHGELSYDFQSYYSGEVGRKAKRLYYERPRLGTLAVMPIVFSEAFVPSARRLFWKPQRIPIDDAHYAMGFAFLVEMSAQDRYYQRARHFLNVLEETRCPGYEEYCWGYPFHWETLLGTIPAGTPLITTVPYVFEAFQQVYRIDGDDRWHRVMQSIARHALNDYKDIPTSARQRPAPIRHFLNTL